LCIEVCWWYTIINTTHVPMNMKGAHILYFFRKSCSLWDNVEKHGRARQATDGNIRRRREDAICMSATTLKTNAKIMQTDPQWSTLTAKIRLAPNWKSHLWFLHSHVLTTSLSVYQPIRNTRMTSAKRNPIWVALSTGWRGWAKIILTMTQLMQVSNKSGTRFQYFILSANDFQGTPGLRCFQ
jgi:hypothetical protein